jgi:hypothetical protein
MSQTEIKSIKMAELKKTIKDAISDFLIMDKLANWKYEDGDLKLIGLHGIPECELNLDGLVSTVESRIENNLVESVDSDEFICTLNHCGQECDCDCND